MDVTDVFQTVNILFVFLSVRRLNLCVYLFYWFCICQLLQIVLVFIQFNMKKNLAKIGFLYNVQQRIFLRFDRFWSLHVFAHMFE